MAFGITPKFTQEVALETSTREEVLVIGIETAKTLGWDVGHVSESGFKAYSGLTMTSWGEEITVKIEDKKVLVRSESTGNQLMDWGKNKRNVEGFLRSYLHTKSKFPLEGVAAKYAEIQQQSSGKDDLLNKPPETSRGKVESLLSIFIPTQGYFITPIILDLNILVFVLMAIGGVNIMLPDTESLLAWGANFRPSTLDGQWWRLLTSCFVHIGIFHLLLNMYALLYIGLMLEPQLGRTRFLSAYLLSGIGGSAASLYWHDLTVSAGASGAIFGLYGVFLAMLTTNLIEKSARKALLTSVLVFVGYNLVNGMKGGIDNAAHIGGLVAGLVIGYSFYPSLVRPQQLNLKYSTIALLTALLFTGAYIVYSRTPNDIGEYDAKMTQFASLETVALEFYQKDRNTSDEDLLKVINDRGLPSWKKCIEVINEAEKLHIPEEFHWRNQKLLEYCNLRISSYNAIFKAIKENSNAYDEELKGLNDQIDHVIKELSERNNQDETN